MDTMRDFGQIAIKFAKKALAIMEAKEDKHEYWQAVFNLRFTCAKLYSRFFAKEQEIQFSFLESSFREYQTLQNFTNEIREKNPQMEITETMQQQIKICDEMVELLPLKLAKFNQSLQA